jgi:glyoxylase-like metal-dependent hydrolase (beta-lactamase superfamily II)
MEIKVLVVGEIDTNCYVVSDPETKEAVVIDPGDEGSLIMDYIASKELRVKYILDTHGHFDHMEAVEYLRQATGALYGIHIDDEELVLEPQRAAKGMLINAVPCRPADLKLRNGDVIEFGHYKLKVIYTPGHTKGGCCFYEENEKVCFSGDTLFKNNLRDNSKFVQV